MADEITLTAMLKLAISGQQTVQCAAENESFDIAGAKKIHHVQAIGTSAEAIDIGDITTCGYCWLRNLDPTNFVTIRMGASGADVIKLKAGEVALFRLAASTPHAIADTGTCNLEILILED